MSGSTGGGSVKPVNAPGDSLANDDDDDSSKSVDRGTSPLEFSNSVFLAHADISPRKLAKKDGRETSPTLELFIDHKEVHAKDSKASSESRLTLYGAKEVKGIEISIHSQSHISVTTTMKDDMSKDTSTKVMKSVSRSSPRKEERNFMLQLDDTGTEKKKSGDTVMFSGKKSIYHYDYNLSPFDSPTTESAAHVTDTGISMTRTNTLATDTDTITSPVQRAISDTAVDTEAELTDAGLSPIQTEVALETELEFYKDEQQGLIFSDMASSPVFATGISVALSPLKLETSEAAVSTDVVETKDVSLSPLVIPENEIGAILTDSTDVKKKAKERIASIEDIVEMRRRGSSDVKTLVRHLEQGTLPKPVDESPEEKIIKVVQLEQVESQIKTPKRLESPKKTNADIDASNKVSVTHTKQVKPKIKQLQQMFTESQEQCQKEKSKTQQNTREIIDIQRVIETINQKIQIQETAESDEEETYSSDIKELKESLQKVLNTMSKRDDPEQKERIPEDIVKYTDETFTTYEDERKPEHDIEVEKSKYISKQTITLDTQKQIESHISNQYTDDGRDIKKTMVDASKETKNRYFTIQRNSIAEQEIVDGSTQNTYELIAQKSIMKETKHEINTNESEKIKESKDEQTNSKTMFTTHMQKFEFLEKQATIANAKEVSGNTEKINVEKNAVHKSTEYEKNKSILELKNSVQEQDPQDEKVSSKIKEASDMKGKPMNPEIETVKITETKEEINDKANEDRESEPEVSVMVVNKQESVLKPEKAPKDLNEEILKTTPETYKHDEEKVISEIKSDESASMEIKETNTKMAEEVKNMPISPEKKMAVSESEYVSLQDELLKAISKIENKSQTLNTEAMKIKEKSTTPELSANVNIEQETVQITQQFAGDQQKDILEIKIQTEKREREITAISEIKSEESTSLDIKDTVSTQGKDEKKMQLTPGKETVHPVTIQHEKIAMEEIHKKKIKTSESSDDQTLYHVQNSEKKGDKPRKGIETAEPAFLEIQETDTKEPAHVDSKQISKEEKTETPIAVPHVVEASEEQIVEQITLQSESIPADGVKSDELVQTPETNTDQTLEPEITLQDSDSKPPTITETKDVQAEKSVSTDTEKETEAISIADTTVLAPETPSLDDDAVKQAEQASEPELSDKADTELETLSKPEQVPEIQEEEVLETAVETETQDEESTVSVIKTDEPASLEIQETDTKEPAHTPSLDDDAVKQAEQASEPELSDKADTELETLSTPEQVPEIQEEEVLETAVETETQDEESTVSVIKTDEPASLEIQETDTKEPAHTPSMDDDAVKQAEQASEPELSDKADTELETLSKPEQVPEIQEEEVLETAVETETQDEVSTVSVIKTDEPASLEILETDTKEPAHVDSKPISPEEETETPIAVPHVVEASEEQIVEKITLQSESIPADGVKSDELVQTPETQTDQTLEPEITLQDSDSKPLTITETKDVQAEKSVSTDTEKETEAISIADTTTPSMDDDAVKQAEQASEPELSDKADTELETLSTPEQVPEIQEEEVLETAVETETQDEESTVSVIKTDEPASLEIQETDTKEPAHVDMIKTDEPASLEILETDTKEPAHVDSKPISPEEETATPIAVPHVVEASEEQIVEQITVQSESIPADGVKSDELEQTPETQTDQTLEPEITLQDSDSKPLTITETKDVQAEKSVSTDTEKETEAITIADTTETDTKEPAHVDSKPISPEEETETPIAVPHVVKASEEQIVEQITVQSESIPADGVKSDELVETPETQTDQTLEPEITLQDSDSKPLTITETKDETDTKEPAHVDSKPISPEEETETPIAVPHVVEASEEQIVEQITVQSESIPADGVKSDELVETPETQTDQTLEPEITLQDSDSKPLTITETKDTPSMDDDAVKQAEQASEPELSDKADTEFETLSKREQVPEIQEEEVLETAVETETQDEESTVSVIKNDEPASLEIQETDTKEPAHTPSMDDDAVKQAEQASEPELSDKANTELETLSKPEQVPEIQEEEVLETAVETETQDEESTVSVIKTDEPASLEILETDTKEPAHVDSKPISPEEETETPIAVPHVVEASEEQIVEQITVQSESIPADGVKSDELVQTPETQTDQTLEPEITLQDSDSKPLTITETKDVQAEKSVSTDTEKETEAISIADTTETDTKEPAHVDSKPISPEEETETPIAVPHVVEASEEQIVEQITVQSESIPADGVKSDELVETPETQTDQTLEPEITLQDSDSKPLTITETKDTPSMDDDAVKQAEQASEPELSDKADTEFETLSKREQVPEIQEEEVLETAVETETQDEESTVSVIKNDEPASLEIQETDTKEPAHTPSMDDDAVKQAEQASEPELSDKANTELETLSKPEQVPEIQEEEVLETAVETETQDEESTVSVIKTDEPASLEILETDTKEPAHVDSKPISPEEETETPIAVPHVVEASEEQIVEQITVQSESIPADGVKSDELVQTPETQTDQTLEPEITLQDSDSKPLTITETKDVQAEKSVSTDTEKETEAISIADTTTPSLDDDAVKQAEQASEPELSDKADTELETLSKPEQVPEIREEEVLETAVETETQYEESTVSVIKTDEPASLEIQETDTKEPAHVDSKPINPEEETATPIAVPHVVEASEEQIVEQITLQSESIPADGVKSDEQVQTPETKTDQTLEPEITLQDSDSKPPTITETKDVQAEKSVSTDTEKETEAISIADTTTPSLDDDAVKQAEQASEPEMSDKADTELETLSKPEQVPEIQEEEVLETAVETETQDEESTVSVIKNDEPASLEIQETDTKEPANVDSKPISPEEETETPIAVPHVVEASEEQIVEQITVQSESIPADGVKSDELEQTPETQTDQTLEPEITLQDSDSKPLTITETKDTPSLDDDAVKQAEQASEPEMSDKADTELETLSKPEQVPEIQEEEVLETAVETETQDEESTVSVIKNDEPASLEIQETDTKEPANTPSLDDDAVKQAEQASEPELSDKADTELETLSKPEQVPEIQEEEVLETAVETETQDEVSTVSVIKTDEPASLEIQETDTKEPAHVDSKPISPEEETETPIAVPHVVEASEEQIVEQITVQSYSIPADGVKSDELEQTPETQTDQTFEPEITLQDSDSKPLTITETKDTPSLDDDAVKQAEQASEPEMSDKADTELETLSKPEQVPEIQEEEVLETAVETETQDEESTVSVIKNDEPASLEIQETDTKEPANVDSKPISPEEETETPIAVPHVVEASEEQIVEQITVQSESIPADGVKSDELEQTPETQTDQTLEPEITLQDSDSKPLTITETKDTPSLDDDAVKQAEQASEPEMSDKADTELETLSKPEQVPEIQEEEVLETAVETETQDEESTVSVIKNDEPASLEIQETDTKEPANTPSLDDDAVKQAEQASEPELSDKADTELETLSKPEQVPEIQEEEVLETAVETETQDEVSTVSVIKTDEPASLEIQETDTKEPAHVDSKPISPEEETETPIAVPHVVEASEEQIVEQITVQSESIPADGVISDELVQTPETQTDQTLEPEITLQDSDSKPLTITETKDVQAEKSVSTDTEKETEAISIADTTTPSLDDDAVKQAEQASEPEMSDKADTELETLSKPEQVPEIQEEEVLETAVETETQDEESTVSVIKNDEPASLEIQETDTKEPANTPSLDDDAVKQAEQASEPEMSDKADTELETLSKPEQVPEIQEEEVLETAVETETQDEESTVSVIKNDEPASLEIQETDTKEPANTPSLDDDAVKQAEQASEPELSDKADTELETLSKPEQVLEIQEEEVLETAVETETQEEESTVSVIKTDEPASLEIQETDTKEPAHTPSLDDDAVKQAEQASEPELSDKADTELETLSKPEQVLEIQEEEVLETAVETETQEEESTVSVIKTDEPASLEIQETDTKEPANVDSKPISPEEETETPIAVPHVVEASEEQIVEQITVQSESIPADGVKSDELVQTPETQTDQTLEPEITLQDSDSKPLTITETKVVKAEKSVSTDTEKETEAISIADTTAEKSVSTDTEKETEAISIADTTVLAPEVSGIEPQEPEIVKETTQSKLTTPSLDDDAVKQAEQASEPEMSDKADTELETLSKPEQVPEIQEEEVLETAVETETQDEESTVSVIKNDEPASLEIQETDTKEPANVDSKPISPEEETETPIAVPHVVEASEEQIVEQITVQSESIPADGVKSDELEQTPETQTDQTLEPEITLQDSDSKPLTITETKDTPSLDDDAVKQAEQASEPELSDKADTELETLSKPEQVLEIQEEEVLETAVETETQEEESTVSVIKTDEPASLEIQETDTKEPANTPSLDDDAVKQAEQASEPELSDKADTELETLSKPEQVLEIQEEEVLETAVETETQEEESTVSVIKTDEPASLEIQETDTKEPAHTPSLDDDAVKQAEQASEPELSDKADTELETLSKPEQVLEIQEEEVLETAVETETQEEESTVSVIKTDEPASLEIQETDTKEPANVDSKPISPEEETETPIAVPHVVEASEEQIVEQITVQSESIPADGVKSDELVQTPETQTDQTLEPEITLQDSDSKPLTITETKVVKAEKSVSTDTEKETEAISIADTTAEKSVSTDTEKETEAISIADTTVLAPEVSGIEPQEPEIVKETTQSKLTTPSLDDDAVKQAEQASEPEMSDKADTELETLSKPEQVPEIQEEEVLETAVETETQDEESTVSVIKNDEPASLEIQETDTKEPANVDSKPISPEEETETPIAVPHVVEASEEQIVEQITVQSESIPADGVKSDELEQTPETQTDQTLEPEITLQDSDSKPLTITETKDTPSLDDDAVKQAEQASEPELSDKADTELETLSKPEQVLEIQEEEVLETAVETETQEEESTVSVIKTDEPASLEIQETDTKEPANVDSKPISPEEETETPIAVPHVVEASEEQIVEQITVQSESIPADGVKSDELKPKS
ncbi:microtubule-associated protein futsch-like [Cloeon dipterum]|uniref:microtubule-associated protein futsch-like n=1 Tax=Cloeon dipterum TaxID=197152 RepID=UPI0032203F5B